jgi:hypothetical protein
MSNIIFITLIIIIALLLLLDIYLLVDQPIDTSDALNAKLNKLYLKKGILLGAEAALILTERGQPYTTENVYQLADSLDRAGDEYTGEQLIF